jgi:hypothetical protein
MTTIIAIGGGGVPDQSPEESHDADERSANRFQAPDHGRYWFDLGIAQYDQAHSAAPAPSSAGSAA